MALFFESGKLSVCVCLRLSQFDDGGIEGRLPLSSGIAIAFHYVPSTIAELPIRTVPRSDRRNSTFGSVFDRASNPAER